MQAIRHGGDLSHIKRQFPHITDWLDLSTGIAPWSYPCGEFPEAVLRNLPDENLHHKAANAAAAYFGCPADNIIIGAGAQSFIHLLPQIAAKFFNQPPVFFTAKVAYGEYRHVAKIHGCETHDYSGGGLQEFPPASVIVLGNPNNPDRTWVIGAETLADKLKDKGLLVIDEAFCDMTPEMSLVGLCDKHDNIIILKSFGKFFGMAGLRLGFAICSHAGLRQHITQALGVWAVSSPALHVANIAYGDGEWIEKQRLRIGAMAEKTESLFASPAYKVIANSGLFITCRCDHNLLTGDLLIQAAEQGIYIRAFAGYPNMYRVGLPADDAQLRRLKTALNLSQP